MNQLAQGQSDGVLFGDDGKRREWIEWAVKYPKGAYLAPPGGIDWKGKLPETGEWMQNVIRICASPDAAYSGLRGCRVVTRRVVSYTGQWEPALAAVAGDDDA